MATVKQSPRQVEAMEAEGAGLPGGAAVRDPEGP